MKNLLSAAALCLVLLPACALAQETPLPLLGVQIKNTPAPVVQTETVSPTPMATQTPRAEDALMAEITPEEIEASGLGERILMRGMEGEDVRLLQRRLYQLGYYLGKVDGVFGLGTRTAVYGFQRAHKLEKVDGKIGPESISRMFGKNVVIKPTPTPSPTPKPTPSPTPTPTPKPTPAPTPTPDASIAAFALREANALVGGTGVELMLGESQDGKRLYPLSGVLAWMDFGVSYAAGSWQFVNRETGEEIALMTDGQNGLCAGAMGSCAGAIFLADDVCRVYVLGEEAYVTEDMLACMGVSVLLAEGVPVISR